jgi:amino acid transporter
MARSGNSGSNKFGTFKGVFTPSTEAILGTVLFLLMPAMVADVGLIQMLLIVILAHTVSGATAFSISDCATNLNTIGGGGMYALARRSLGKAFGGSIGIQLYFAQAASIAFYCIGFVEPLQPIISPLLSTIPIMPDDPLLQKQVMASLIFILFFVVVMIGADFTLKIQSVILVVLFTSVAAIFLSPFYDIQYDSAPLFNSSMNLSGNRPVTMAIFFLTFTQFFPAVVGIDAGVGMSGDLKDPKRSLVRGTFLAIAVTFTIYIGSVVLFSAMNRELLAGNIDNYDFTQNPLGIPRGFLLTNLLGFPLIPETLSTGSQLWNILQSSFPIIIPGILVLIGILFATSSSALSCFMTAPRTVQALARDNILPRFLRILSRDFKPMGNEPRFATLITFFIGISIIWIGNINMAAMIVGICFLIVYSWINLSAFFERISRNPTFRPTSKNHWLVSLYGFLMSLGAICLFDWRIGILIVISQMIIFWLILKFKTENRLEGVWWGVLFSLAKRILASLSVIVQGSKNWRPIVSAISFGRRDNNSFRVAELGKMIAAYQGLVYHNVLQTTKDRKDSGNCIEDEDADLPTSCITLNGKDIEQVLLGLSLSSHPGGITPNTILIEHIDKIKLLPMITTAIDQGRNVLLLKNGEKLIKYENIDIWWRGQQNGNLMVLLAYIINNSLKLVDHKDAARVRIIRKLGPYEDQSLASKELAFLLEKARLSGEVLILPHNSDPIKTTIDTVSGDSDLIMMGMPGRFDTEQDNIEKLFKINERFFDQEITKYDNMPATLFVKSAYRMNLIEE